MEDKIKANAELVIQQLGPLSGLAFGYNADSIAWIDGFIEQQRIRPEMVEEAVHGLVNVLGAFMGECIIRCFGGHWSQVEDQWCVRFDAENCAYPFNKVRKQFANGAEDSITWFFENIPLVFKRSLEKQKSVAHLGNEEKLETFIRQAEEAYSRIYDEWSRSDRAAAYNECKESMASAIHLAREMKLTEKIKELEGKLEHYKNVFRHQMNF